MDLRDLINDDDQLGIDLAGAIYDLIDQLVAMRKARKLTQADVAERMGVDRSVISRFETAATGGRNPNLHTVWSYAETVGAFIGFIVAAGEDYPGLKECVEEHRRAPVRNPDPAEASFNTIRRRLTDSAV